MNSCAECQQTQNCLIQLFLELKGRQQQDSQDLLNQEQLEKLQSQKNEDLVQFIASSFEILLEIQENQTRSSSRPKYCDPSSSSLSPNSLQGTEPGGEMTKEHEEALQKLENDIRLHIRTEQQFRLHIESLQQKIEDLEGELEIKDGQLENDMAEVRREKRRLDDLLTIREGQVEKSDQEIKVHLGRIHQLEVQVQDWEKRYKHQERKFEKHIAKLALDRHKDQGYHNQSTTGSSGNITQNNLGYEEQKAQKMQNFTQNFTNVSLNDQFYQDLSMPLTQNTTQIHNISQLTHDSRRQVNKSKPKTKKEVESARQKVDQKEDMKSLQRKINNMQATLNQDRSSISQERNNSVASASTLRVFKQAQQMPQQPQITNMPTNRSQKRDDSSGHKRSKTTLNFYPNKTQAMNCESVKLPFDVDKENKFLDRNTEMEQDSLSYGSSTFLRTYREHAAQPNKPFQSRGSQEVGSNDGGLKRNKSQDLNATKGRQVLKNSSSIAQMASVTQSYNQMVYNQQSNDQPFGFSKTVDQRKAPLAQRKQQSSKKRKSVQGAQQKVTDYKPSQFVLTKKIM